MRFMKKKQWSRGFTLIEILVTLAIVLMLGGILVFMVIRGKMIWQSSVTRSASRQDIQVLSLKIVHELKSSDVGLITDGSSGTPKAFSFVSAYDKNCSFVTNDSGTPVWQKFVIYYIKSGTSNLLRKEVAIAPADLATLKPLTLSQLSGYLDGKGITVSPSVTSITLTPDAVNNSAVLNVATEAKNRNGKTDRQSRQLTVSIYNQAR